MIGPRLTTPNRDLRFRMWLPPKLRAITECERKFAKGKRTYVFKWFRSNVHRQHESAVLRFDRTRDFYVAKVSAFDLELEDFQTLLAKSIPDFQEVEAEQFNDVLYVAFYSERLTYQMGASEAIQCVKRWVDSIQLSKLPKQARLPLEILTELLHEYADLVLAAKSSRDLEILFKGAGFNVVNFGRLDLRRT